MSLKNQLLNHLQGRGWTPKSHLEDFARSLGYLGDNSGRRCREMVADGQLEVKFQDGQNWYKLVGEIKTQNIDEERMYKLFN